jgi:hypothetical protein
MTSDSTIPAAITQAISDRHTFAAPVVTAIRRLAVPDLLIAGVAILLVAAVVVNGVPTAHDMRRARLDKKVAARWYAAHAELGRFGPPRIKVRNNRDLACAARQVNGSNGNPIDGYCIEIADTSTHSTQVLRSYQCFYPRAAALGKPTRPPCLARH